MLARPRLDRSSLRLQEWPQIDDRVLADAARATYRLRRETLRAYVGGTAVSEIEALGVDRRTLHRLLARALRPHADGRIWGWRALVPQARVKPYERLSAPKVLVHTKAGNAGAFAQLLARFPALESALSRELTSGRVHLVPGGELGRLKNVKAAAERFRQSCRDLGLTTRDYP